MSLLGDLLAGKHEVTSQHGTQSQTGRRTPLPGERQPFDVLMRWILGQMVNPPNTAISVPQQQALSNLQGGAMGLANAFGIGGQPNRQTGGLQTREQMGLPDRKSYQTFVPTPAEVQALGIEGVHPNPQTVKDRAAIARAEKRGSTAKADRLRARHPEGA